MRQTSQRRHSYSNRGKAALPDSTSRKPLATDLGKLSYNGDDAVECPACGVMLDPKHHRAGKQPVPKHARFGWPTSPRGRPPCQGYIQSMTEGG